jgi:hypothetical protein
MSLEEFKNIDIHDSGVEDLIFSFSTKSIKIILSIYQEQGDYNYLEITFLNVESIAFSGFEIIDFSSIELYSRYVHKNANGSFKGKFVFLLGSKMPSAELTFNFIDITCIWLKL